jgi:hypothetical protein
LMLFPSVIDVSFVYNARIPAVMLSSSSSSLPVILSIILE